MAEEKKRLMIVDDTEIDRIILKSMLSTDFEVMEANSGNVAFEYLTTRKELIDAILLDISMPHIDGFDVLNFMKDKGVDDIPVFLVTAEPTRENVERAMRFNNIAEFIGKPFDKEDILHRLRSRLGVAPAYALEKTELTVTRKYISDLRALYRAYLTNFEKDDSHYVIMEDLMALLLNNYNRFNREVNLPPEAIEVISAAAYFCDIGEMLIPDRRSQLLLGKTPPAGLERSHVDLGSAFIRLNKAKSCAFFVEICSSMCLHHHERYDGTGYPNRIKGDNNNIYNQMCRLVDEFDIMRSKFYGDKSKPVSFIVRRLLSDTDMVGPEVLMLLDDSEKDFFNYFMKKGL